ncbi:hypothetical protein F4X10_14210 [Candidatus Poribacteria bacterium]|nr:hypothetical protein [Candidatus Poribacteria bacterium]
MKRGKKSRKRKKNRIAALNEALLERIRKRPLTRQDEMDLARTRQLGLNLKARLAEIAELPEVIVDDVEFRVQGAAPTFNDVVELFVNLGLNVSMLRPEHVESHRENPTHIGEFAHGDMSEAFMRAQVDLTNEMGLSNLIVDENGFMIGVELEF